LKIDAENPVKLRLLKAPRFELSVGVFNLFNIDDSWLIIILNP
jgi:hypothetical protein